MNAVRRISVVICTYNRAHSLGKTLESVVVQSVPSDIEWEIIVVDNNSSDQTREIVESFQSRYPERMRYAFEGRQGVSNARNTGVRESRGQIVAFIDDDETADPNWLESLTANLHSGEWAGAGGRVQPQWSGPRPNWISCKSTFLDGPLAMFDYGAEAMELNDPPFGANMAFRKEMLSKYGEFRTDLGRVGMELLSGEDTEFGRRLIAGGERLRYEPSAITLHPVEKNRATRRYFLSWWFNKGRTDVRDFWTLTNIGKVSDIPWQVFRGAAVEAIRWIFTTEPCLRFICLLKIWTYAGQFSEYFRQTYKAKRKGSLLDSNVPL
jgi:glucosyl-dolichyl phosphate glucuronosyltransferase